jgi:hypothetical protein
MFHTHTGTRAHFTLLDLSKRPVELLILIYEGVPKSFRTGRLERELQMAQLSATRCSYIAIL